MSKHAAHTHEYVVHVEWHGDTSVGYTEYSRQHVSTAELSGITVTLSADPAFRGDPALLNPEQLLVMAATSCQLLSFLALAARKNIPVLSYRDTATAVMPEDDPPTRITRIVLNPRITVGDNCKQPDVAQLVQQAHEQCYIANSLRSAIEIGPQIQVGVPTV